MSALDVVRQIWDVWEVRDMEAVTDLMNPDVVHDVSHYPDWGDGPIHEGVGPALNSLGDWLMRWYAHRQDVLTMEEDGDRVLVVVHQTGEQSGVPKDEEIGVLFFVGPDDLIAKWEPWLDVEAARVALHEAR